MSQCDRMISDVLGQSCLPNISMYPQIKDHTVKSSTKDHTVKIGAIG